MSSHWTTAEIPDQTGRRILITGANSGIGFAAARELLRHNATVVLGCRDRTRGEAALAQLRAATQGGGGEAELLLVDLASLDSVRRAADAELARGLALHCLINNAGIMAPPTRRETVDGFEVQFGTNVLGPFALTCRLMPALELGRGALIADRSRVVTIASIAHKRGVMHFDDLQGKQHYEPRAAYAQTKLANLLFTFELERRLEHDKRGVASIAAHPGVAQTNIIKIGSSTGVARLVERAMMGTVGILLNSDAQGALPTLFAATADAAEGGGYYGPQGLAEARGGDVGPAKISAAAQDVASQARLWAVCEELTGTTLPTAA